MKGTLLIFCGIPGSGKTTIAKAVAERVQKSVHVQTDAVRAMLPHPEFSAAESEFVYGGSLAVAREALRSGYTVILDGTFMREEYRAMARKELRRYASRIDLIFVACGLDAALRRNGARGARIPPDKLRSIHRRFEVPARALRIDSSRVRPDEAASRVVEALF